MPIRHKKYRCAVVWMRRAFRLDDNLPLMTALHEADEVVPIVCLSSDARYAKDSPRRSFVRGVLADLDKALRERGSALHVRMGKPAQEIARAAEMYGAEAVFASRVYDPAQLQRDEAIRRALESTGRQFTILQDSTLRGTREIVTSSGNPFKVFTPFKRAWLGAGDDIPRPVSSPSRIPTPLLAEGSCALDRVRGFEAVPEGGGETAARRRLQRFLSLALLAYDAQRDVPGIDGTSRLSSYLSLGALSIRRVYWKILDAAEGLPTTQRKGADTFVNEILWREFYCNVLANFPHVAEGAFKPEFASLPWHSHQGHFNAWRNGLTGYPIVDAGMRQLSVEGWMHNRVRMIVASFLTKDLHLTWQWGEKHFFEHLIDADLASNNGGWQWTAGTGTDASPWFRVFNPVLQAKKFDPEGSYVKKYVPELSRVPSARIHEPWRLSRADQVALGCTIGKTYPRPIVDHQEERKVTLALYSHRR